MTMTTRFAFLAVAALLAPLGAVAGEVVQLDDANFEHHTQAGEYQSFCFVVGCLVSPSLSLSPTPIQTTYTDDERYLSPLSSLFSLTTATGQTAGAWFVKFYAPWCGHCKSLEPDWNSLADSLSGKVIVARLDCTANPATADRFKDHVRGFPTLLLFRDRKMFKHSGARTLEAMSEFAVEKFAAAEGAEVPAEPTAFERGFSELTRALALGIIRAHEAAEACMKTLTKDAEAVGAAWKQGGFGGAYGKAAGAAGAAPKLYGILLVAGALTSIGLIMAAAVTFAPVAKVLKDEKKDN
jgi:protein disulfide-isomerase-like protein